MSCQICKTNAVEKTWVEYIVDLTPPNSRPKLPGLVFASITGCATVGRLLYVSAYLPLLLKSKICCVVPWCCLHLLYVTHKSRNSYFLSAKTQILEISTIRIKLIKVISEEINIMVYFVYKHELTNLSYGKFQAFPCILASHLASHQAPDRNHAI